MSDGGLDQIEADYLLKLEKYCFETAAYPLPDFGGKLTVPLFSSDKKEAFILDIYKGRIDLSRERYQTRARNIIILARLDFGSPHRNPDGEEIGVPHLHLYREGYGDKWAYPVPEAHFPNLNDHWEALMSFMDFCAIVKKPNLNQGLFS